MEFIPIQQKPKRKTAKQSLKSQDEVKNKKNKIIKKTVVTKKEDVKKKKLKVKKKLKKKVNNKKKGVVKNKKTEEEEEDEEMVQEDKDDDLTDNNAKDEDVNENEDEEKEDEDDDDDDDEDDDLAKQNKEFAQKCQRMDEKMKTRLFVKFKTKIKSEAAIRELHPDIKGVIFPRKKNSRWCWAVFSTEQKADQALKKLSKRTDILVNKPNPYNEVHIKQQKKMKTVMRKKEARKKFVQMWV